MKMIFAALALVAAPAMAQEFTPEEKAAFAKVEAEQKAADACIAENVAKLAKASTEPARDLVSVIIERCSTGTIGRYVALTSAGKRAHIFDAIVTARTE